MSKKKKTNEIELKPTIEKPFAMPRVHPDILAKFPKFKVATEQTSKVDPLTPEQTALVQPWKEFWRAVSFSTNRDGYGADFDCFERNVDACYIAAGFEPPKLKLRACSPMCTTVGSALLALVLAYMDNAAYLKDIVRYMKDFNDLSPTEQDNEIQEFKDIIGNQIGSQVHLWLDTSPHTDKEEFQHIENMVSHGIHRLLKDTFLKLLKDAGDFPKTRQILELNIQRIIADSAKEAVQRSYWNYLGGQFWVGWQAAESFFDMVCGYYVPGDTERARLYRLLQMSVSWWWPCRDFVISSQYPLIIKADENLALHCEDGPAIAWPGHEEYMYHGHTYDPDIILGKKPVTLDMLNACKEEMDIDFYTSRFGIHNLVKAHPSAKVVSANADAKLHCVTLDSDAILYVLEHINDLPDNERFVQVPNDFRPVKTVNIDADTESSQEENDEDNTAGAPTVENAMLCLLDLSAEDIAKYRDKVNV